MTKEKRQQRDKYILNAMIGEGLEGQAYLAIVTALNELDPDLALTEAELRSVLEREVAGK